MLGVTISLYFYDFQIGFCNCSGHVIFVRLHFITINIWVTHLPFAKFVDVNRSFYVTE